MTLLHVISGIGSLQSKILVTLLAETARKHLSLYLSQYYEALQPRHLVRKKFDLKPKINETLHELKWKQIVVDLVV